MTMKTLRSITTTVLAGVAVALIFSTLAVAATVEIKSKEGIGSYLADAKGMTLYLFTKDAPGKSACVGPCVEKWPLFTADNVIVPDGVKAADFAVITREDGKKQTTYKGLPLYYFVKDVKPGDTMGQGVNGVWYVVAP
jgi:predicted lipoprotein with Yx(FWY)xxD motif